MISYDWQWYFLVTVKSSSSRTAGACRTDKRKRLVLGVHIMKYKRESKLYCYIWNEMCNSVMMILQVAFISVKTEEWTRGCSCGCWGAPGASVTPPPSPSVHPTNSVAHSLLVKTNTQFTHVHSFTGSHIHFQSSPGDWEAQPQPSFTWLHPG